MTGKMILYASLGLCLLVGNGCAPVHNILPKTNFQVAQAWRPSIDVQADAAIIYGTGDNVAPTKRESVPLEERAASWREHGYHIQFMTGIAWGQYQDYFDGRWDGATHFGDGQIRSSGDTIWHDGRIPYIVPSRSYLEYFKEKIIKRVIDAGISEIFLEEPEFWAYGGYSEGFKQEWQQYYGSPWQPQHSSPEATWLSNKLKYHLYGRALDEVCTFAKQYGRSRGVDVKCYIPTHSLLSYTQIRMVSPEASLAQLEAVDGYIAQVWTGTARGINLYEGRRAERVFEMAYLEYGFMESMVVPTGRRVWFLTDPVEDWPRDWADYRRNYHATYVAQMLYPDIDSYEVMPWPQRIYEGLYHTSATDDTMIPIPGDYATMMQVMTTASRLMPSSRNHLSGSRGVNILVGDSMMFQSYPEHRGYQDPALSSFFGLAMPLVKRGVPVQITHIENLPHKDALKEVKVLLMSYSGMKPLSAGAHEALVKWMRGGGHLVYCSTDTDPFQSVPEWWNTGSNSFSAPADHLFSMAGIPTGAGTGTYSVGRGSITVLRTEPKDFAMIAGRSAELIDTVSSLYEGLEFKNNFTLDRGPYKFVAVMEESVSDSPVVLEGCFVDLFDPELPVFSRCEVAPGVQKMLYDVSKAGRAPVILASASRAYDIKKTRRSFSYTAKGPQGVACVTRILLPHKPSTVLIDGHSADWTWDAPSRTMLLRHPGNPDGVQVSIIW